MKCGLAFGVLCNFCSLSDQNMIRDMSPQRGNDVNIRNGGSRSRSGTVDLGSNAPAVLPSLAPGSIMMSMDRFVRSVNKMVETIMVPTRLMDLTADDGFKGLHPSLIKTDLYGIFNMLREVKEELVLGSNPSTIDKRSSITYTSKKERISALASSGERKLARQGSSQSMYCGDSDSESVTTLEDSSSDSGLESIDTDSSCDRSCELAAGFRFHLLGLNTCLSQLADAADYVTYRYKEQVGCSM